MRTFSRARRAMDSGRYVTGTLCAASLVALSAALVTLALVATPAQADTDSDKDWQHCVQIVANLRAEHPRVPVVVLLGGSSARECTVSDASWARQIKRRSGYEVLTYNLGSKHRTYSEDLEFVKLLPRTRTIVYIGINLGRFCLSPSAAAIDLPQPRSIASYSQHHYSRSRIQSPAEKRAYVAYWMDQRWPEFQANCRGELTVLERIIRVCDRRHLRVALLDLPRDLPTIGSAFRVPVARYQEGCARLARQWGIPWLHFVGGCRFVDRDFFDVFHLVEPGRVKFQSVLADKTIRLLDKYVMGTPSTSASPSVSASPSISLSASPSGSRSSSAGTSLPSYLLPGVAGIACVLVLAGLGAKILHE